jgi:hypothetical protein
MKEDGWEGHVAHEGKKRNHTGVRLGDPRERDHLEDQGVNVRIILKQI